MVSDDRRSRPSRGSGEIAVAPLEGMPEGAPSAIDARAARLALSWASNDPLCCARGAPIDGRSRIELVRARPDLRWSSEGPIIDGGAPSGIVERLAEQSWGALPVLACAALDATIAGEAGGVRGDGCSIRGTARALGRPEDHFLLTGCALFPLEVVEGVLVPSPRIPEGALVEAHDLSLWDDARARFAIRWGDAAAKIVDAAAQELRRRSSRHLHLRTLR